MSHTGIITTTTQPGEEIEAALQEAAAANSNYDRMTVGMVEESVLHSILERECIP